MHASRCSCPTSSTRREADWTLDTARRLLAKAAGAPVGGLAGGPDPFVAVQEAVATGEFDEIIISTLPRGVSKWLRRDLVTRVRGLGLPVTSIIPGDRPGPGMAEDAMGMTGGAYHSASRGSGARRQARRPSRARRDASASSSSSSLG